MFLNEAIEQLKDLKRDRESFLENNSEHDEIFLKDIEAIDAVLQVLEQPIPKKIIAPGRRGKKNTYEFGLVVGTKRERDYWESKIKEKIEEIKEDKDSKYYDKFLEQRDIDNTIEILEELLEG